MKLKGKLTERLRRFLSLPPSSIPEKSINNIDNTNSLASANDITVVDDASYLPSTDSTATLGLPPNDSCAVLVAADNESGRQDGDAKDRQTWDSPIEFLLSCISMSVGLGNVWRFPFTAYENGGGAFLIPYLVVLLMVGRPLYLLELSIGQFSSSGCVKMWDLAPGFRGIGYGQCLATFIVGSYYCVLIGTSWYYLFASFQSVLPWTVCHPDLAEIGTICLPSSHNRSELNLTSEENITLVSSSEQYFQRGVLKGVNDISDGIGVPDAALAGCLLLCWLLIYLTLRKGVSSSGKVAYFTAIFPYLVMITLLGKGLSLPGAFDGVKFLFLPQWEKLAEPRVWYAAVTQSFFSLSVGFGSIITFSSYNRFEHDIYRDATIISIADTLTSILAGVITFSILGHLAAELGMPIDHVIKSGTGLAFITYPEVVAKFSFAPQLFAVLFFLMLITLGMGSAVGLCNVVITVVKDAFPGLSKSTAAGLICLAGMLTGIVFTTPGGQPLLELVDYYGGSLLILVMALSEVLALTWVYGREKLMKDLNFMLGCDLGIYWKFCWFYFIPVALSSILAYTLVFYKPVDYADIDLPLGAQLAGWSIFVLGVLIILGFMSSEYVRHHYIHKHSSRDDESDSTSLSGWRQWKARLVHVVGAMFSPLESWGPSSHPHRGQWLNLSHDNIDSGSRERVGVATISNTYAREMDLIEEEGEGQGKSDEKEGKESPKLRMKV